MFFGVVFFVGECGAFAQSAPYLLPNEKTLYSFHTRSGKRMVLATDTGGGYIVYRFGSKGKIELEYPDKNKASWDKFTYSYYLRGGGKKNDGLDLNYLRFERYGHRYLVYDLYSAVEDKTYPGVRVFRPGSKNPVDLQGIARTRRGSLLDCRFDERITKKYDRTFD